MLDSYREQQSPAMLQALARHRSPTAMASSIPVVLPGSYPFPLTSAPNVVPQRQGSVSAVSCTGSSEKQTRSFNVGLADTAMTTLVLILAASSKSLANFLESYIDIEGKDNTARLLSHFFQVATSILNNDAFPTTWLNVNILSHKIILKICDPIAFILLRDFIPNPDISGTDEFNVDLWREVFMMLLGLLSSDQLVIEDFSPQVKPSGDPLLRALTIVRRNGGLCGDLRTTSAEKVPRSSSVSGRQSAGQKHCQPKLEQSLAMAYVLFAAFG